MIWLGASGTPVSGEKSLASVLGATFRKVFLPESRKAALEIDLTEEERVVPPPAAAAPEYNKEEGAEDLTRSADAAVSVAPLPTRQGAQATPLGSQGATPPRQTAPQVQNAPKRHAVTVIRIGEGTITSDGGGILCGDRCEASYEHQSVVTLKAAPAKGHVFKGWSADCSGDGSCSFVIRSNTMAIATFDREVPLSYTPAPPYTAAQPQSSPEVATTSSESSSAPPPQSQPQPATSHLLISEIVAGIDGNANYEFVELYNPTSRAIDLTGWSVKKKSSTGSESSLVASSRLEGKTIGVGKYFLLANEGGYTGTVPADALWAKSNTLAYTNNAIALYDANGATVEAVSWSEIPKGESYARVSWGSSQFSNSSPTPKNSSQ